MTSAGRSERNRRETKQKKKWRREKEADDEQVQQQPRGMPIIEGFVDENNKAQRQTQTKNKRYQDGTYLSFPYHWLLKRIKFLSQNKKILHSQLFSELNCSTLPLPYIEYFHIKNENDPMIISNIHIVLM